MWFRRIRKLLGVQEILNQYAATHFIGMSNVKSQYCAYSIGSTQLGIPRKVNSCERKPMVTSMKELKRQGRLEKKQRQTVQEIALRAPENGMLVKEMVPVAREVYSATEELFACVSAVARTIPIYCCSLCGEVHIGHPPHQIRTCNVKNSLASKEHSWKRGGTKHILPIVESFHLYDRIGRAVSHDERLQVDRIPAIAELCIQAGFDIPEYPMRRRTAPVYNVSGRIIDFERRFPKTDMPGKDINIYGFWNREKRHNKESSINDDCNNVEAIAIRGMDAWEKMCSGSAKLMQKYAVQTRGYCSEVQVGPKGHRVRNCFAYKHQMRDGQHGWQEATVDDIIPPVYVWHVRDTQGVEPLVDRLQRYYGKLPAVVELFAQAGAHVGEKYVAMMKGDVAVPELGEERLVV